MKIPRDKHNVTTGILVDYVSEKKMVPTINGTVLEKNDKRENAAASVRKRNSR